MALCYCLEEIHFSRCGEHVNDKALSEGGRERGGREMGGRERGYGREGEGDGGERGWEGEGMAGRGDGGERGWEGEIYSHTSVLRSVCTLI